jgi:hypothetical protein
MSGDPSWMGSGGRAASSPPPRKGAIVPGCGPVKLHATGEDRVRLGQQ